MDDLHMKLLKLIKEIEEREDRCSFGQLKVSSDVKGSQLVQVTKDLLNLGYIRSEHADFLKDGEDSNFVRLWMEPSGHRLLLSHD